MRRPGRHRAADGSFRGALGPASSRVRAYWSRIRFTARQAPLSQRMILVHFQQVLAGLFPRRKALAGALGTAVASYPFRVAEIDPPDLTTTMDDSIGPGQVVDAEDEIACHSADPLLRVE